MIGGVVSPPVVKCCLLAHLECRYVDWGLMALAGVEVLVALAGVDCWFVWLSLAILRDGEVGVVTPSCGVIGTLLFPTFTLLSSL